MLLPRQDGGTSSTVRPAGSVMSTSRRRGAYTTEVKTTVSHTLCLRQTSYWSDSDWTSALWKLGDSAWSTQSHQRDLANKQWPRRLAVTQSCYIETCWPQLKCNMRYQAPALTQCSRIPHSPASIPELRQKGYQITKQNYEELRSQVNAYNVSRLSSGGVIKQALIGNRQNFQASLSTCIWWTCRNTVQSNATNRRNGGVSDDTGGHQRETQTWYDDLVGHGGNIIRC